MRGGPDTSVEVLLIDDSPGDVRLTIEALRGNSPSSSVAVVGDGVDALAYLRREGPYHGARRPDLILLDLNLPGKDGREVLAEIKTDERLCTIPVVVLTTSAAEEDVARAYALKANGFVTKPVDLDGFFRVLKAIERFWLLTVTLPRKDPEP